MFRSEWDDLDERHPACRCGCGELADECGRATRRAVRAVSAVDTDDAYNADTHDYRPTCAWRGCTLDADYGRLCDVHHATL